MLKQFYTLIECSRIFSLPTTICSWLTVFVYSLINSGNVLYGILSFFGLCFAHLGTNVLDDYIDYKLLIAQVDFDKEEYLKNSQKTKCRYILSGLAGEKQVLITAAGYFVLAGLIGLFLFIKCGIGVLYFALAGGIIGLFYPMLSRICLSEAAVALAYGPALFGGVYYVMTGTYSKDVFWLSCPTMIVTVVLLYIHTVMDYEFDIREGKHTIANLFDSPLDSLAVLKWMLTAAYLSVVLLCIFDITDWQVFLVYLTIPLAKDLYYSLKDFACAPESVPAHKWYHFPMENMEQIKNRNEESFMIRMYQARNLIIYFSLFYIIGIIFSEAI